GLSSTDDLVRATAACFIAVYVLAILSALRILSGRIRLAAAAALVLTLALAVFSAGFLLVPALSAVLAYLLRRNLARRDLSLAAGARDTPADPLDGLRQARAHHARRLSDLLRRSA